MDAGGPKALRREARASRRDRPETSFIPTVVLAQDCSPLFRTGPSM